jgi:SAM-dependent methyltransferase
MRSSVERFTSRVGNYVKYRPSYPAQVLDLLVERCGLSAESRVADIGSGTGILTQLLLGRGAEVWGVEPNEQMRAAAERLLGSHARFHSVAGTAEGTTLPSASIDIITAAQAFHWFDASRARLEFARMLVPGGKVALIWNERPCAGSPFLTDYEALLVQHSSEYGEVSELRSRAGNPESARKLFGNAFELVTFPNSQALSFQGLLGRLMSSSYAPEPHYPSYELIVAGLHEVFARHQRDGEVMFNYETRVYLGQLS